MTVKLFLFQTQQSGKTFSLLSFRVNPLSQTSRRQRAIRTNCCGVRLEPASATDQHADVWALINKVHSTE